MIGQQLELHTLSDNMLFLGCLGCLFWGVSSMFSVVGTHSQQSSESLSAVMPSIETSCRICNLR